MGDTNIIEQHVTEITCLNVIHPTLKLEICQPTDYTRQVIVWRDPHHDREVMGSLGTYDAQQQRDFILIQDLYVGGAIQAEYGPDKNIVQLDNGLALTKLKNNTDLIASLKEVVVKYASIVADNAVAPLLEAHIVHQ